MPPPELTRELIRQEYVVNGLSLREVGRLTGYSHTTVAAAVVFYGYPLRSKSQAQRAALQAGRHPHPTRGRTPSAQTRRAIGEGVSRAAARRGGQNPGAAGNILSPPNG